ncbi:NAD-dependent dihydropyrimidine dehydrogenase subunit PreA [Striga asiatica]|uniref:NAD-dependent dihydropyrimidine dehydrogenase subunit PreA n=1 Tax=Striga asiatica TaxID=4170 RepID=A0A5A7PCM5_STRAF|nr:NAD-dependent dihydropyrimidine dehydrogenase subunit PreA [Striga asiatica]
MYGDRVALLFALGLEHHGAGIDGDMHEAIGGINDSNVIGGVVESWLGAAAANIERVAVTVTVGDGAVIVILWGGKAEALQSEIVLSSHIVHQPGVGGLVRVHVASPPGPHGCLCPVVQYGPSLAVSGVGERIMAGDQSGWAPLSRVAMPETWRQAMEVPERMLNSVRRVSEERPVGDRPSGQAARMLTPGAISSGLR